MSSWERYGLAIAFLMFTLYAQANGFTVFLAQHGSPITPELYGEAAYEIPAILWMKAQEWPAGAACLGALASQSKASLWRRLGAAMTWFGAVLLSALFVVFAYFAKGAEQGAHVYYLCLYAGLPLTAGSAVIAGRYFFWGDRE